MASSGRSGLVTGVTASQRTARRSNFLGDPIEKDRSPTGDGAPNQRLRCAIPAPCDATAQGDEDHAAIMP